MSSAKVKRVDEKVKPVLARLPDEVTQRIDEDQLLIMNESSRSNNTDQGKKKKLLEEIVDSNANLLKGEKELLKGLLNQFLDVFAFEEGDQGRFLVLSWSQQDYTRSITFLGNLRPTTYLQKIKKKLLIC